MTAETVQSLGGVVLEECSGENCVIILGSKIGAAVDKNKQTLQPT